MRWSHKKAELSQRWPRDAPYISVSWKLSGVPDYAHGYFSRIFLLAFVPIEPINVRTKFEVCSFTRSWDNRGTQKFGQSLDRPTLPFLQNFNGLLFGWALWMFRPNLKFATLPVPEIIRCTPKIWSVPGYAHALFSPKISNGLSFGWTLWM